MKATKLLLAAGTALPLLALAPAFAATTEEATGLPLVVAQATPSEGGGRGRSEGASGGDEERPGRGGRGGQGGQSGEPRPSGGRGGQGASPAPGSASPGQASG